MKNLFIVTLFIFIMVLSTGCSNGISKEVTLEKIDISKSKDNDLEETLIDIVDEGIYALETDKQGYIIFNGLKNEYKDIDYELKDDILTIKFNKINSTESTKKVYKILPFPTEKYKTLELIQNGEEISFENIYIKK